MVKQSAQRISKGGKAVVVLSLIFFSGLTFAAENQIENVDEGISRLKGQVAAFQTQISNMLIDRKNLEKKISDLVAQADEQKQTEQDNQLLIAQLENVQKQVETRDGDIAEMKTEIGKSQKNLEITKNELKETASKLKESLAEKEKSNHEFEESTKKLQSEIMKKDEDMKAMTSHNKEQLVLGVQRANAELVDLKKENAVMHYNLSVFYSQQANYTEAVKELEHVVRLDPSNALAHFNLGLILDKYLSQPVEAAKYYSTYMTLLPQASDAKDVEYRIFEIRLNDEKGIKRDLTHQK